MSNSLKNTLEAIKNRLPDWNCETAGEDNYSFVTLWPKGALSPLELWMLGSPPVMGLECHYDKVEDIWEVTVCVPEVAYLTNENARVLAKFWREVELVSHLLGLKEPPDYGNQWKHEEFG